MGVNPLRGQNNVQGSCDMGSFPHEFPGYRHVGDDGVRAVFEEAWNVGLQGEPGLRIRNMFDAAVDGTFKGLYIQGEDVVQSDPNTKHVTAGLGAMECIVVQDLFLNETASYAHVFLPGSSFLEKDGTFTNAERRLGRVRKAIPPMAGLADWEITVALSNALGYPMNYAHPSEIMDEIARLTPTFAGVTYEKLDELGSIQWPCNEKAPEGTPIMHVGGFVRGKGQFMITEYVATDEKPTRPLPAAADDRPNPLAVQRRRPDAAHAERHVARRGRARDSPLGRREPRHQRRRPRVAHEPRRRDDAPRADLGAHAARRRLHHVPLPRHRTPTSSPPSSPTGPPTAPSTR